VSTIAAWSYTQTLTVWPASSYDKYGQPTFGTPYTLTGSWAVGGDTVTDDDGSEFVAMSKYYFQLADGSASLPKRGGYIKRGALTGTANPITAGAEQIKKIAGYDMGMFGSAELPDWIVYT
jgi:hypothetical protein